MTAKQLVVVVLQRMSEKRLALGRRITADIFVIDVVGGRRNIDGGCRVVPDHHHSTCAIAHVTIAIHMVAQCGLEFAADTLVIHSVDGGNGAVCAPRICRGVWCRVPDDKGGEGVGLHAHHNDTVGHGGEDGAAVVMSVLVEGDGGESGL